jgi:hypothetical protein
MSLSTHVTGFTPPDGTWQQMKAVWDACEAARVPVPEEVATFFGDEPPDPAGVETGLPLREWNGDSRAGYELDVAAIPPQVQVIRFYNSW